MDILVKEENGLIYSTVDLIARHCEVKEDSVRRLVTDHKDEFINLSNNLKSKFEEAFGTVSPNLKIPEFKLETSASGKNVSWKKTKFYQPHIEYLLTLMENTKVVSTHKRELIIELFILRAKALISEYEKRELQRERDLLLLEKENNKLEKQVNKLRADKFIEYNDGYHSMSRIVRKNFPHLTTTQAFNMLDDLGHISTKEIITTKRIPINIAITKFEGTVIKYDEQAVIDIINNDKAYVVNDNTYYREIDEDISLRPI